MTPYVHSWLRAFVFTQIVEVPIYMQVLPGSRWKAATIGFGASAITHPFVWFVFPRLLPHRFVLMATAAELFAFVVEALYLCIWLKPWKALAASFVANSASLGLGLLSRRLFDVP